MTARRTRTIGGVCRYVLLLLPCLRMGVPNPVETTRPLVLFLGESIRPHPPEEIVAIHPGSMAIECGGTRCFLRLFFLGTLAKDVAWNSGRAVVASSSRGKLRISCIVIRSSADQEKPGKPGHRTPPHQTPLHTVSSGIRAEPRSAGRARGRGR